MIKRYEWMGMGWIGNLQRHLCYEHLRPTVLHNKNHANTETNPSKGWWCLVSSPTFTSGTFQVSWETWLVIRSDWGGNGRFCNEGDNNDGDRIGLPSIYQFWFKDKSNHGIWIYPLRYSREMRRWKSIPKRREAWKAVFGGCQDHWRSRAPIKDWSLTLHQTIPKDDRKHFSCPPHTCLIMKQCFQNYFQYGQHELLHGKHGRKAHKICSR